MLRAGLPGGFAAWLGFTLPSALAYGVGSLGNISHAAWLHGLKIVAVAVVAQAVWRMAQSLPDRERVTLAVAATLLTLAIPSATGQIGAIMAGGGIGWRFLPSTNNAKAAALAIPVSRASAIASLILFAALLFGLPMLATATSNHTIDVFSSFYRSGSLVFGGGHVVLPLLQQAVVPRGWISNDEFLAGYGAAQAVPGPLFTFAAYLGDGDEVGAEWLDWRPHLPRGDLPAILLLGRPASSHGGVIGAQRRQCDSCRHSARGALYAGLDERDFFGLGVLAFLLLVFWRVPRWLVVILGALGATALAAGLGWHDGVECYVQSRCVSDQRRSSQCDGRCHQKHPHQFRLSSLNRSLRSRRNDFQYACDGP
jgi:chromate transporter